MTISTTDYILEELRINNRLLQRLIEIQHANALLSLAVAEREGHITKEGYDEIGAVIDGKRTLG